MSETKGSSASLLSKIHLFVTILIAILGGFISFKQLQLNQEQQAITNWVETRQQKLENRKTITEQSAELLKKANEYLEVLHLDDDKKKLILISLLQLEKELRISETGELSDEQILDKVNALPHHMALLAGASEALAHIGGKQEDLKLWIPIATTSGDVEVRKAAIDALRNIALLTAEPVILETCVEAIITLTRRWNVPELREQAEQAITSIARAYTNGDVDDSSRVNTLLSEALRELEGALPVDVETPEQAAAPRPIDASSRPPMLAAPPEDPEAAARTVQMPLDPSAVRQLRQIHAPISKGDLELKLLQPLIDDLQSTSVKKRRLARSWISDFGERAIPDLLSFLADNPENYSIKAGVVTALLLMEQPVSLQKGSLDPLILLLGDADATVRKNTAVFLGKLTDRESLEIVRCRLEDLSTKPQNLENGNLIYNSVIVPGDWLKYNPAIDTDLHGKIKQSLRNIRGRLEKDARNWRATIAEIDERL